MHAYGHPAADAPIVSELATLCIVPATGRRRHADPVVAAALKAAVLNGRKTISAATPAAMVRASLTAGSSPPAAVRTVRITPACLLSLIRLGANIRKMRGIPTAKLMA